MSTSDTKNQEIDSLGKTAIVSAEIAAESIRKYLELHTSSGRLNVNVRMALADLADKDISDAIDANAKAAINNLERYLKSKK
jgi:carbon monoxide dehydrogenase subunit G